MPKEIIPPPINKIYFLKYLTDRGPSVYFLGAPSLDDAIKNCKQYLKENNFKAGVLYDDDNNMIKKIR